MTLASPLGIALGQAVTANLAARDERERYRDIYLFAQHFFGTPLNPLQAQMVDFQAKYDWTLVEAPPGHGKSWYGSYIDIVYTICWDRAIRGLFGTSTDTLTKGYMQRILDKLEDPEIVRVFGKFKTENWSTRSFSVIGHDPQVKEPTLSAFGVGASIEGMRLTHAWLDDPIGIEAALSNAARYHAAFWLDSTLLRRIDPGGKVRFDGSAWHVDDIYQHAAEHPRFHRLTLKAIISDDPPQTLWPEQYPYDALIQERDHGKDSLAMFNLRYQQDRHALMGKTFRLEWLGYVEPAYIDPTWLRYMGCDYNISEKDSADYTVVMVVVYSPQGEIIIIDIFRDHLYAGWDDVVYSYWQKHNAKRVAGDAVSFQHLIGRSLTSHPAAVPYYPITSPQGSKAMRVLNLEPFLRTGRVKIVKGCPFTREFVSEYVDFGVENPGCHDDMLDALEMAVSGIQSARPAVTITSSPFGRR